MCVSAFSNGTVEAARMHVANFEQCDAPGPRAARPRKRCTHRMGRERERSSPRSSLRRCAPVTHCRIAARSFLGRCPTRAIIFHISFHISFHFALSLFAPIIRRPLSHPCHHFRRHISHFSSRSSAHERTESDRDVKTAVR